MTQHPSVNVCPMCGLLIGNRDLHDAWHVKGHAKEQHILSAVSDNRSATDDMQGFVLNTYERLAALENG